MTTGNMDYARLLALLLEGSVVANFEFWSEFIIRIQRDEAKRPEALKEWFGECRIPSLFSLRLRGKWWIGDWEKWIISIQQFPMKATPPMPIETALQASTLIMMLDSEISKVDVDDNSNIKIVLSDGRALTILGKGQEWDESWFLELPIDDPDRDKWQIVCTAEGVIGGRFPGIKNEEMA